MSKDMEENPAIAELTSRAVLRVSGADSVPFLQNLISQDMAGAAAGKPVFSALLTPQGKYLYDFFVVPDGKDFLLDAEAGRIGELQKLLTLYRIRGDVQFGDGHPYKIYVLWDGADHKDAFADPRLPAFGKRLLTQERVQVNSNESAYRELRYSLGVAEGSHEIALNNSTLADVNFDALNGVSYTKGCYMGQELTARIHHRALVKKRTLPFRFEGPAPQRLAHIMHNGYEIGEIHAVGERHGLGLYHLEHVKPFLNGAQALVHDGTSYEVYVPDYLESFIR